MIPLKLWLRNLLKFTQIKLLNVENLAGNYLPDLWQRFFVLFSSTFIFFLLMCSHKELVGNSLQTRFEKIMRNQDDLRSKLI